MDTWLTIDLQAWYQRNKRRLPWREEKDPYRIWLSEIILQQTQVAQGLSYYYRFIELFPTVFDLAGASEDQVLKAWQGLGYYSRARNLHSTAKEIVAKYDGRFPGNYLQILELRGIGEYTAAAISSFAFDQPYAVLDGNVFRFLSRLFGVETPIDSSPGKKEFNRLAMQFLDQRDPSTHNQAIMEFGSQVCKPVNPLCSDCIFQARCFAYTNSRIPMLPVKGKKTKVRTRFLNYIVLIDDYQNVYIKKREQRDIWQGLYEFFLLEDNKILEPEEIFNKPSLTRVLDKGFDLVAVSPVFNHVLTHQRLSSRFNVLRLRGSEFPQGFVRCSKKELNNYAFPRLITRYMQDCGLKEMF